MKNVRKNSIIYWYSYNLVIMHLECVVIVAYKKTIKREKQEGIMSMELCGYRIRLLIREMVSMLL